MKERPILFSAPMVQAILVGNKTQTRRIVKGCIPIGSENSPILFERCPYGQVGDQLWVRETFSPIYPQDPTYNNGEPIEYDYAATYKHGDRLGDTLGLKKAWKPSIHMPRKASRIQLEITNIRVERLQDISETDARHEGIKGISKDGNLIKYGIPDKDGYPGTDNTGWPWDEWCINPIDAYKKLWQSINGAESWQANPWVWVVEFKVIDL